MSVQLQDASQTFAQSLEKVVAALKGHPNVTIQQLLELVGEQGMILLCMLLMLPFLLPVSVPGVSTIFSGVVILVGISVTLNTIPWLPKQIRERELPTESLIHTFEQGIPTFARIDRFIRPSLLFMTNTPLINRINGLMFIVGGIFLIFPFALIPFSNTLPGLAILLLGAGMIQRDGRFILAGYLMNIATFVYFGGLFWAAIVAGQNITSLFGA